MVKLLRRGAVAGLLAGAAFVVWRFLAARKPATDGMTFAPAPFPSPPRPVPRIERLPETEVKAPPAASWVEPEDGTCPASHPVKANVTSGIFHVPGGLSYDRTNADRCYADPAGAEADGLRQAKR